MNLDLEGRLALVAGSSRGIGLAIATALLREGARVVLSGRDPATLDRALAGLAPEFGERAGAVAGDLGPAEGIEAGLAEVRARWGDPEILVANVGTGAWPSGWDVDPQSWAAAFEANLFGAMRLARAALPAMIASGRGSIVFTGSIAGLEALSAPLAYGAAKAALVAAAQSLSRLVGHAGVRVNVVAPGNVLFEGGRWEGKLAEDEAGVRGYIEAEVPLRRFGRVEEIGRVVAFLASPAASFVTGACWVVDGGQTRAFGG